MSHTIFRPKILILTAILLILMISISGYRWLSVDHPQETLSIGISPPYAELLEAVAEEVRAQGIAVKLIEFSDWQAPNVALHNGDIDANFFQQSVFLENAIRQTGYDLKPFAVGTGSHVGLYSKKYRSLAALPDQATVVIPSDPVNLARALILLHRAQLIVLKDVNNQFSSLKDILSNPKQLRFSEVEGPQTARAYAEADLIFGFPHYLKLAKVAEPKDALFLDPIDKKYAILFVTRGDYQDKQQKLQIFVDAFHNSKPAQQLLDRDFGQGMWFKGWL